MNGVSDRIKKCGSWWRGQDEGERFLLYYSCLRVHYEMPAKEAFETAKRNWAHFGPAGDLMTTLRSAIKASLSTTVETTPLTSKNSME